MFIKTLTKLAIISIQRLCNRGNLHPPYNEKREKAETFSLYHIIAATTTLGASVTTK